MIRDKNIFECIILNNQIWLPNYVCWGPPSMGHHRRSILFKRKFPNMENAVSSKETWDRLRKKHIDKRRIFQYNEDTKVLKEIDVKDFFMNSWGEPIYLGETFELKGDHFKVEGLKIVKWVGLLVEYTDKNNNKKQTNFSFYKKSKDNIWRQDGSE